MKIHFRTIILVLFIGLNSGRILAEEPAAQPLDFDWAVQLLTTTNASPRNAWLAANARDLQEKSKFGKLLEQQTAAVAVLQKSHKEIDLKVLVPFLGYTTNATYSGENKRAARDDIPERKKWPVFALILDMPNAAPALEKYSMDQSNPAHCRVDAFHVYMYLDKYRAAKVGDALTAEFQNSIARSNYVPYIARILKGTADSRFDGPVDDFDRTGYENDPVERFNGPEEPIER